LTGAPGASDISTARTIACSPPTRAACPDLAGAAGRGPVALPAAGGAAADLRDRVCGRRFGFLATGAVYLEREQAGAEEGDAST